MTPLDIINENPLGAGWLIAYLSAAGAVIAAVWRVAFRWIRSLDGADTYRAAYTYHRREPAEPLRAHMLKLRGRRS